MNTPGFEAKYNETEKTVELHLWTEDSPDWNDKQPLKTVEIQMDKLLQNSCSGPDAPLTRIKRQRTDGG